MGTLPQELNSLQLTGEPIRVQRKKKPSGAQRKCLRKQKEATAVQLADIGPMSIPGGSSRTKRPLSPGETPQDAQSQVKRTKKPSDAQWKRLRKQKEAPYNS